MFTPRRFTAMGLIALVSWAWGPAICLAGITQSGNTTVAGSTGTTTVGDVGSGTLTIDAASILSNDHGVIGNYSTGAGTTTVKGLGSRWDIASDLIVAWSGRGSLNILDGATVTGNLGSVDGSNPLGYLTIVGYHGYANGTAVVSGSKSRWTVAGAMTMGFFGTGSLTIENGGTVSDWNGIIGAESGGVGSVLLTGTASRWNNSVELVVGHNSSGSLRIERGGKATGNLGFVGQFPGSRGVATITGAGSSWTAFDRIAIGNSGTGKMTLADGGKIIAPNLSVNNVSSLGIHVSNDSMVLLGTEETPGAITNNGRIALYAGVLLPAGVYRPITEFLGNALNDAGSGSYDSLGGVWDNNDMTLTVASPKYGITGQTKAVSSFERLLINDESGQHVGLGFGVLSPGRTVSARPLNTSELAGLRGLLDAGQAIVDGWAFTSNLGAGESLITFDIGPAATDYSIWKLTGGVWRRYTPDSESHEAGGAVNFTADSLTSYAIVVPEPAAMGLAFAGLAMAWGRRRRGCTRP